MENKCKDCKHFQMGTNCIDGMIIFDPFAKALCVKYNLQTSYNQKAGSCFEGPSKQTNTIGEQLELFQ